MPTATAGPWRRRSATPPQPRWQKGDKITARGERHVVEADDGKFVTGKRQSDGIRKTYSHDQIE